MININDENTDNIFFANKYVFLKTDKESFKDLNLNTQKVLLETENIHIYQSNHKQFMFSETFLNNNIFFYSFNTLTDNFCFDHGYIPHFCFNGSQLFNSERVNELNDILQLDDKIEVFWFPTNSEVTNDIESFVYTSNTLKSLNTPICISFSSIFNNPLNIERYNFLEKLLRSFNNPLYIKESDLLEKEVFSSYNFYIEDLLNNTSIHQIVLGLYGDEIVTHENILDISKQTLSKNKKCLICENFQNCSDRGLGYIQFKNNITNCIGISLLQQK